jgi:uncharacterized membrane protein (DUF485 family)
MEETAEVVEEEEEKRDLEVVDKELRELAGRRWRIALTLTGVMMATYFGFLFLVAYAKPLAGSLVSPGLSWGILLGALVIVVAWIVTGIYVSWANSKYDTELAKLRKIHDDAVEGHFKEKKEKEKKKAEEGA